jgi:beta-glucosidase
VTGVRVSFTVTNTGDVTADEVAQLYARAAAASVPRPRRELVAHRRVTLAPGQTAELSFDLPLTAFAFWDVAAGRWRVEPGPYELLAGASSEDVRGRTTVTLDGEPAAPRPVLEHGLQAADFDEQSGTAIVDRSRAAGDAVTPVAGKDGELVFRRCDFGAGVAEVRVEVSGEGTVEVSLDGGPVLAALSTEAPTPGPYDYVTLTAPVTAAVDGVHDVRLGLRGPVRLARAGFSG